MALRSLAVWGLLAVGTTRTTTSTTTSTTNTTTNTTTATTFTTTTATTTTRTTTTSTTTYSGSSTSTTTNTSTTTGFWCVFDTVEETTLGCFAAAFDPALVNPDLLTYGPTSLEDCEDTCYADPPLDSGWYCFLPDDADVGTCWYYTTGDPWPVQFMPQFYNTLTSNAGPGDPPAACTSGCQCVPVQYLNLYCVKMWADENHDTYLGTGCSLLPVKGDSSDWEQFEEGYLYYGSGEFWFEVICLLGNCTCPEGRDPPQEPQGECWNRICTKCPEEVECTATTSNTTTRTTTTVTTTSTSTTSTTTVTTTTVTTTSTTTETTTTETTTSSTTTETTTEGTTTSTTTTATTCPDGSCPSPTFTPNPVSAGVPGDFSNGCSPAPGTGTYNTLMWGDGTDNDGLVIDGATPVSHTYNNPGTYSITFQFTDANGCVHNGTFSPVDVV